MKEVAFALLAFGVAWEKISDMRLKRVGSKGENRKFLSTVARNIAAGGESVGSVRSPFLCVCLEEEVCVMSGSQLSLLVVPVTELADGVPHS